MFPGVLLQILAALGLRLRTDAGPGSYGRTGAMIDKADSGSYLSPRPRFLKTTAAGVVEIDVLDPDGLSVNVMSFPNCLANDVIEFEILRVRTATTSTFVVGY